MKKCTICKTEKDLSEFNKHPSKKDGLQSHCRICNRERSKAYYKRNPKTHRENVKRRNKQVALEYAEKIFDYLVNHPCVDCGEDDPVVLEFDHLDRETKNFAIGNGVRLGLAWARIEKEITQCQVLCANCHRRKTASQLGWHKATLASLA